MGYCQMTSVQNGMSKFYTNLKKFLSQSGLLRVLLGRIYSFYLALGFKGSARYWDERYGKGMTSGYGSYNELAVFKAAFINDFVASHGVDTVIEFGCGDGNQLSLASYPNYIGVEVSANALRICGEKFREDDSKRFVSSTEYAGETAELALSLDVIYHLVEDEVYQKYMDRLFHASTRFVIIFSSDYDGDKELRAPHVRHRRFSDWIAANGKAWRLLATRKNPHPHVGVINEGSLADFYVYEKQ